MYKNVADPRGFEPPFSGSEGRRLNPDWATGPVGIEKDSIRLKRFALADVLVVYANALGKSFCAFFLMFDGSD